MAALAEAAWTIEAATTATTIATETTILLKREDTEVIAITTLQF